MALERDNTAERLARIDKLMAETKCTRDETTRLHAPQQVAMQASSPRLLPLAVPSHR